ncbi:MAG: porin family protein [Marinilabiliaceae bacterium]
MKKPLLLAALIALTAFSAQTAAQDSFALGIKAGYNSSQFRTDNAQEIIEGNEEYTYQDAKDEAVGSLILGAFARINLVNNLSFQPELLYAKKGGKTEVSTDSDPISLESTYHTWEIPLLAHLRIIDLKVLNIYGVGGPAASFQVNEEDKWSDINTRDSFSENMETAHWNFQAGGGVEVGSFNFDVRYSWGLNDISSTELERKNNNLTFSLAYKIFDF